MTAVERLFRNRRFHEVTLDDVAKEAHVGKGTIYRFFKNKEDLFFHTATAGFDNLCEILKRSEADSTNFPERLFHACNQITRFFSQRRHLFRMMIAEEGHLLVAKGDLKKRWIQKRGMLVASLAQLLQDGMAEGVVRTDLSGSILATYLLSMLRARAHELVDSPPEMARLELLLDIFWRGIRTNGRCSSETSLLHTEH